MVARKIGSRYTITSVLGRGTCGTVWEGEGPDGPVAVKLLREDLAADQTLIARFVQERTALTSLQHPNVVSVRDLVVDGTDLALVMDLVRGSDLRHRLEKEQSLRPQLAVTIVADVAEGLAAAHAQGIIHRDVKPENILLDTSDGNLRARLADFGIARLVDGPRRTRATRIIGTPDYLAPEVIEGCQPGPPVDLYSLGTVLFELLAGWTPFGGGHPGAVLRRHVTEKIPALPGVPGPLAALVASCLSKGPGARLTAAELADRLRDLIPQLDSLPVLNIPDPRQAGWDVGYSGRTPTVDPVPMRHTGIVPLVNSDYGDDSRETHLNLMRPIRDGGGDVGVRRRSGGPDASAPRSEAAGSGGGGAAAKRPRWLAATAAALLVGGAAAAVGMTMSGAGDPKVTNPNPAGKPVGTRATTTPPAATTKSASAVGISFAAGRELPAAPVTVEGAPSTAVLHEASGSSTLYVFIAGTDGSVWFLAGDSSHTWTQLRGLRVGAEPAVVATAQGRLDVFATADADGQVQQRTLNGGTWSPKWTAVGQVKLHGAPGALATGDGGIVLAGVGSGQSLLTTTMPGNAGAVWADWAAVPSVGDVAPGVAFAEGSNSSNYTVYVPRVSDQAVLAVSYADGAWSAPKQTALTGWPAVAATGDGTPYVFVRSANGAVRIMNDSGRVGAGGMDSALPPAVASTPDGKIAVVTAVSPTKLRVAYSG